MLLLTLRGTPTLYYGDEIGMRDVPIPPERVQDPLEKSVPGIGLGRDPERTPMQWSAAPQAGFSTAEPWLPLAEDFAQVNVAAQRGRSDLDPEPLPRADRAAAHRAGARGRRLRRDRVPGARARLSAGRAATGVS